MPKASENYLPQVRHQYENLPYPNRDPNDELERLFISGGDDLSEINHFVYGGKGDFQDYRVLVAGGGTGDATIYMAEQLFDFPDAQIIHLDMSEASIAVAKQRAKIRGLNNIEFRHGSLLDLPHSDDRFDHINCSGVLHHLQDPVAGLNALKSVLKPSGVINLMLYAWYGREHVYRMQTMLRTLIGEESDIERQLEIAKHTFDSIKSLPWGAKAYNQMKEEADLHGDAGIYDMYLHSQDRAYTVPQLYEYLESCGLKHTRWVNMDHPYTTLFKTDWIRDEVVKQSLDALPAREREAVLEMMYGGMNKHACYAMLNTPELPDPLDHEMVPIFMGYLQGNLAQIREQITPQRDGTTLSFDAQSFKVKHMLTPYSRCFLRYINAENTVRTILEKTRIQLDTDEETVRNEWLKFYSEFHELHLLFLRHSQSPSFYVENYQLRTMQRIGA